MQIDQVWLIYLWTHHHKQRVNTYYPQNFLMPLCNSSALICLFIDNNWLFCHYRLIWIIKNWYKLNHTVYVPLCLGSFNQHFFFFSKQSLTPVTQAGVQCCDLSSQQPLPPWVKLFSCCSLLSSWNYSNPLPHLANFVLLVETRFRHIGQAGLELLTSGDPPTSASQSAGIIGVRHCTQTNKPLK